jgi:hypothetical protein
LYYSRVISCAAERSFSLSLKSILQKLNDGKGVLDTFQAALATGLVPDLFTRASLISAYGLLKDPEGAERAFHEVR